MKIRIYKDSRGIIADAVDLPGTSPVGVGTNKYEAIGSLFSAISHEQGNWAKFGYQIEIQDWLDKSPGFGFRVVIHGSIQGDALSRAKELCDQFIGLANGWTSYGQRHDSAAFYRRGNFGLYDEEFQLVFRRLHNSKRIFGVVPLSLIESVTDIPINLKQCMCAIHRGGQKVRLVTPYSDDDFNIVYEKGLIDG